MSNLISSWKHQDENNFIPCQWSELQQSLEKERTTRIHLQNELNKVKEELEESKGFLYFLLQFHNFEIPTMNDQQPYPKPYC